MRLSNVKRSSFLLLTHILVAALALIIGYRFGSGLQFSQLLGYTRETWNRQSVRLVNTAPDITHQQVDFSVFWETWSRLERDYYDPTKLDAQKMVDGAVAGLVSAVGDPYTVYLAPETKQRLTEDLQGEFGGVGIQLGYRDGQLAVISPIKGHPAEAAGVRAGEFILRIVDKQKNVDKETIGMSAEEAVSYIRGETGTKVTLAMALPGEEPRDVELTREIIEIPSLELEILGEGNQKTAHIILSRFGDKTITELDAAVAQIQADPSIRGIVLDMRGNPGGYLEAGIDVASEFINGGLIVSQKGRYNTLNYRTTRPARLANYPVEVLVNKGSASAAEIVAGALRDRREAELIGEQTFGKGSVQDAQMVGNSGAGLNITIARWLLPSGESIQDTGLPVTIEVADDPETENDEVLDRALVELYN